jgi:hypothetical protein
LVGPESRWRGLYESCFGGDWKGGAGDGPESFIIVGDDEQRDGDDEQGREG